MVLLKLLPFFTISWICALTILARTLFPSKSSSWSITDHWVSKHRIYLFSLLGQLWWTDSSWGLTYTSSSVGSAKGLWSYPWEPRVPLFSSLAAPLGLAQHLACPVTGPTTPTWPSLSIAVTADLMLSASSVDLIYKNFPLRLLLWPYLIWQVMLCSYFY